MKHLTISIFLVFLLAQEVFPQGKEFKNTFVEADSYYLFGEYEFANSLFLILYDQAPDNALLAYKIGNCYLNTPFEKSKAIPYLEEAIKNTDYGARESSYKEQKAPLDAFFALGNAYRVNGEFEKAQNTYKKLKSALTEENKLTNADFIDQQIEAIVNAGELMKSPVFFFDTNLGDNINIASVNFRPVLSGDESVLVYTCKFGEDDKIYFTRKENGGWLPPEDITLEIGSNNDCETACLSHDGTELYLYKTDGFIGNIFVSKFINDRWSTVEKLNNNINTKYFEAHASISKDGNTLFFASNREGGFGGLDIYQSVKQRDGEWGKAINLGESINSPYNETAPFITENDSLLYFSSEGHYNMGGYDIFISEKENHKFEDARNIGYPLSTTDDDLYFHPVNNGKAAYYSMTEGYKSKDIHRISFEPPVCIVNGKITVRDPGFTSFDSIRITVVDSTTSDIVLATFAENTTGNYSLELDLGSYSISYEGSGFQPQSLGVRNTLEDFKATSTYNVHLQGDFKPIIIADIPTVDSVAQEDMVTDVSISDVGAAGPEDTEILYYTIQLMALINPVDVSYFHDRGFEGAEIFYGQDEFYRYVYGKFPTEEEAESVRQQIIQMGYADVFIKKVFRQLLKQNLIEEEE